MVNTLRVNADHEREFNPLADHMTQLRHFTNGENRDFSAFRFSLQSTHKSCTYELACCSEYWAGFFCKINLK